MEGSLVRVSNGLDREKVSEEPDLLASQGRESQPQYALDRLPNGPCLRPASAAEKGNGQ